MKIELGEKNDVQWKAYNCDCRVMLQEYLNENSIDCIVTSPPYYNLRSYGAQPKVDGNVGEWKYAKEKTVANNEIGIACSMEKYLSDLREVFALCYRVLKDNKFMFVNVGNSHRNKQCMDYSHNIIGIAKDIGFIHSDTIIWIKRNAMPMGKHNKIYLANGWEYVLMFAKGKNYKINKNAYYGSSSHFICEKCGAENLVELKFNPNYFYSNIGCFGRHKKSNSHPAPFPEELPRFCFSIAAKENDLVLDPFVGSGTTLRAAVDMKLNCIGCELIENIYLNLLKNMKLDK